MYPGCLGKLAPPVNEKPACVCPIFQTFFPTLSRLAEVWHHSWIHAVIIEVSSVEAL